MDTLGKLGFVYDVEHIAPNGEVVDRQHFHNLMPDEGIRWALAKTFVPKTAVPSWSNSTATYDGYTNIRLSFFKNLFEQSKIFDSMKNFCQVAGEVDDTEQADGYWDGDARLELQTSLTVDYKPAKFDLSTNTLTFAEVTSHKFLKPTVITGLFLMIRKADGEGNKLGQNYDCLLLSEAFFPNPIQMETNGTISVTCGCALISS